MKKLLLMLILVVFTIPMIAQETLKEAIEKGENITETVTTYVTDSEVEKLVDKYTDKIGAAFTALSEKLEQPVEYVWNAFVKVNFAKGIIQLLFPVSFIISLIMLFKFLKLLKDDDDNEFLIGCLVVSIVIGVICLFATIFTITEAIPRIVAPEYYALKEVFELFK